MTIAIITGDLTQLKMNAIVNAANPTLLGGGGVDGAIHQAAGPALLEACRALPETRGVRCPVGEARITPGFDLPARYVIHTVGPIWQGGVHGEAQLLTHCYRASIALAREHGLQSIAFPAISCGVYSYPPEQAARVSVAAVRQASIENPDIQIFLCGFNANMSRLWENALNAA